MRAPVLTMLIAAAAGLSGCKSAPQRAQGYALLDYSGSPLCDATLRRPSRPAEIPPVSVAAGYGSVAGVVFRVETGNGIAGASVSLSPLDSLTTHTYGRLATGQTGGFAFDSIVPGRYLVRVIAQWPRADSSFVEVASNRVDTVRFPVRVTASCGTR